MNNELTLESHVVLPDNEVRVLERWKDDVITRQRNKSPVHSVGMVAMLEGALDKSP